MHAPQRSTLKPPKTIFEIRKSLTDLVEVTCASIGLVFQRSFVPVASSDFLRRRFGHEERGNHRHNAKRDNGPGFPGRDRPSKSLSDSVVRIGVAKLREHVTEVVPCHQSDADRGDSRKAKPLEQS